MIKVGDRVKFLSEALSGIVKSIDGTTATVLTEDDFEIPTLLSDLIVVDKSEEQRVKERIGYDQRGPGGGVKNTRTVESKQNNQKREIPRYGRVTIEPEFDDDDLTEQADEAIDMSDIRRQIVNSRIAEQETVKEVVVEESPLDKSEFNLKFAFEPVGDTPVTQANMLLWIENNSSYRVLYTFATEQPDNRSMKMISNGEIEPNDKIRVMQIDREQLASSIKLSFNALLFKESVYIPQEPILFSYQTQPMKFVKEGTFVQSSGYSRPVFKVNVASDKSDPMKDHLDPVEIIRALKQKGDIKQSQRKKEQQPEVVDLHAEELFSSLEGMTPNEILQGQIGRFELSLDLALKSGRGGRMVFIHGVGSGKLKHEIKKILTTKYKRLRFQDASFAEYGYGAIMIFLK